MTTASAVKVPVALTGRLGDRGRSWGVTLVTLVITLSAWEFGVALLKIPAYLLPPPSRIGVRLWEGFVGGSLPSHTFVTLQEISLGYLIGCAIAIGLGTFISQFRTVEQIVWPYVVAWNSVPKVALAPLIVLWFGYGLESKVVIAALVSFFPLLVNVILGLRSSEREQLALMRSLSATRWQTFRMVQVPNALPAVFAGLEVAIVSVVIGAVIGEFVGAKAGLGYYILFSNALVDTGGMFAAFIVLAVIGTLLNQVVKVVGRRVVFWRRDDTVVSGA